MTFLKNHFSLFSSLSFLIYLTFFQYPFLKYELGVLTSYINNFNALNEISFWNGFFGESFFTSSDFSPLKLNLIAWSLFILSKAFSQSLIFSFAPIIFSTCSFYFSLKIFELYKLQKSWSVLLAFLGMTSIASMPLFETLASIISFKFSFQSSSGVYFDLLTSFSSSMVLAGFLGLLYLTLKAELLKSSHKNLLPTLWALSVFIHPSLFIFGFSFILLINFIDLRKMILNKKPIQIKNFLIINFLPLVLVLPYIIYNVSFFGSNSAQLLNAEQDEILFFIKGILLYFIIPFGLMLIANRLYRVDPYESLVRFWPILLIALIEVFLRVTYLFNLLPINDEVFLSRVAVYFLHFFYYVPFLSVVTRKFTYLPDIHNEDNSLKKLRKTCNYFFINLGNPISFLIIVIISLTTYSSINHDEYLLVDNRAKELKKDVQQILLDEALKGKKIQFLSMDEKIIAGYLFPNNSDLNNFLKFGSSSQNREFDFLINTYQRESIQPVSKLSLNILEENFDENSFIDNKRNLALALWLKYNNVYYDINGVFMNDADFLKEGELFFISNYLVSKNSPNLLQSSDDINSKKLGNYLITYSK
jgi:hypothetical protein